jgi:hypothetical protein
MMLRCTEVTEKTTDDKEKLFQRGCSFAIPSSLLPPSSPYHGEEGGARRWEARMAKRKTIINF